MVVDNGLFLHVAQKISEQYGRTLYFNHWETCMPKISSAIIGDGFDGLEKCESIWDEISGVDLFCFLDVGQGALQRYLRSIGKVVWGHNGGDELETDRGLFLRTIKSLGMDCPKYATIKGLTNLSIHLKDKKDKYVKTSKFRGDFETFHWRSWREDESTLDEYAFKLGPAKEFPVFYVLDPIETDIEDGVDSYCIDGKFPKTVMHGIEMKDKSYLCSVQDSSEIDPRVWQANENFSPILKRYGYRGFFSSEVRVSGDKGYFIDPTCRCGSPPSQVMTELFSNLGEIIWQGANGNLIEPDPAAKFGVQALLTVPRDCDEWIVMDIPDSIRQWTKCGFASEINGRICEPPHEIGTMAGWLVAIGDTIKEAIDNLKAHAKELPGGADCDVDSLAKALIEMETAKDEGIKFTGSEIPDPSSVID